jgi:hypothetical protein
MTEKFQFLKYRIYQIYPRQRTMSNIISALLHSTTLRTTNLGQGPTRNWQLQQNHNLRERTSISSTQLVSRLAGAAWGNVRLITCSYYLKWVCLPANFVHFFSAMSDNIDPAIIWWWLRRHCGKIPWFLELAKLHRFNRWETWPHKMLS